MARMVIEVRLNPALMDEIRGGLGEVLEGAGRAGLKKAQSKAPGSIARYSKVTSLKENRKKQRLTLNVSMQSRRKVKTGSATVHAAYPAFGTKHQRGQEFAEEALKIARSTADALVEGKWR